MSAGAAGVAVAVRARPKKRTRCVSCMVGPFSFSFLKIDVGR